MRRDQGRDQRADELERLLAERGNWLMGIAIALTGRRADAEDLAAAATPPGHVRVQGGPHHPGPGRGPGAPSATTPVPGVLARPGQ